MREGIEGEWEEEHHRYRGSGEIGARWCEGGIRRFINVDVLKYIASIIL